MARLVLIALFLALGLLNAQAADLSRFPQVTDQSYVEPGGRRVLQLAVEVDAPTEAIWRAWTTAEGWESFAVRHCRLDRFGVGGVFETSYAETFTPGGPETIRNEIVAYVPYRILAIRNVKAPAGFENAEAFSRTITVLEFAALTGGRTRVLLTGVEFEPTPAFEALYEQFALGNAFTLDKLRQRFAAAP